MNTDSLIINWIFATLIIIIIACTANGIYGNYTINKMVKSGIDPIVARCSVSMFDDDHICLIVVQK